MWRHYQFDVCHIYGNLKLSNTFTRTASNWRVSIGLSALQLGLIQVQCQTRFMRIEPGLRASAHIPFGLGLVDIHCYCNHGWTHLNPLQPTSVCGLATTQVQPGFIDNTCSADTLYPDSTWVQALVRTSLMLNRESNIDSSKTCIRNRWWVFCSGHEKPSILCS